METPFYEPEDQLAAARDMRQALKRKIDASFFTENTGSTGDRDAVNRLKKNMKLDFNSAGPTKQSKLSLLQSPDLNMLKLASPELEKMIIQANGMVTTTPTPTQFIFPKFVTEEQEAYARGFVDALAELHTEPEDQPTSRSAGVTLSYAPSSNSAVSYSGPSSQVLTTTTSLPGGIVNSSVHQASKNVQVSNNMRIPRLKEEPQIVPTLGGSPPLSPINMESQERIKLERKRARNRVAARKCRTRKLERISRLEDRVSILKGQNQDLVDTASTLREQVCKLKQQIIEHVNSGCQIMMTQNMSF